MPHHTSPTHRIDLSNNLFSPLADNSNKLTTNNCPNLLTVVQTNLGKYHLFKTMLAPPHKPNQCTSHKTSATQGTNPTAQKGTARHTAITLTKSRHTKTTHTPALTKIP
eukprot:15365523-Ditylum_brightwellii.AAC.2